jgi:hypothetical protein
MLVSVFGTLEKERPIGYHSLKEWFADAGKCDDTANFLPEIREQRQCFKLVSAERLGQSAATDIDWEEFAFLYRPAVERGSPLPAPVVRRCLGD